MKGESAESAVFQSGDVLWADVLQEPQNQSESAERHSHTVALLERQAKEDVLSERNRLQTLLQLELGNTHTHKYIRTHTHTHTGTHTFALKVRKKNIGVSACFKKHIPAFTRARTSTHNIHVEIRNSTLKLLLPWIHFTMATAEEYV